LPRPTERERKERAASEPRQPFRLAEEVAQDVRGHAQEPRFHIRERLRTEVLFSLRDEVRLLDRLAAAQLGESRQRFEPGIVAIRIG
jgi:hypothetical protein